MTPFPLLPKIVEAESRDLRDFVGLCESDDRFLVDADFAGVDLRGQDLRGLATTSAKFSGARVDSRTRLSEEVERRLYHMFHVQLVVNAGRLFDVRSGAAHPLDVIGALLYEAVLRPDDDNLAAIVFVTGGDTPSDRSEMIDVGVVFDHAELATHNASALKTVAEKEVWAVRPGPQDDFIGMRLIGSKGGLLLSLDTPAKTPREFLNELVRMDPTIGKYRARLNKLRHASLPLASTTYVRGLVGLAEMLASGSIELS